MNENICSYCNKKFSSKSNLKNHNLKAKYCLKKRNETQNNNYNCEGCLKKFTSKQNLDNHNIKCSYILIKNQKT